MASDLAGPAQMFLTQARGALSSGHVFGIGGEGFVRINYATSATILRAAIQRMGAAARLAPKDGARLTGPKNAPNAQSA